LTDLEAAPARNLLDGDKVDRNLAAVAAAAYNGRVDSVFLAEDQVQWGGFREDEVRAILHPQYQVGDEDMINFVAVQTVLNGGRVLTGLPDGDPAKENVVALYRY
jgi:hypothetical protein